MSLSNVLSGPIQQWANLYTNNISANSINLNDGALTNVSTINGSPPGGGGESGTFFNGISSISRCTITGTPFNIYTRIGDVVTLSTKFLVTPQTGQDYFELSADVPPGMTITQPQCIGFGFFNSGTQAATLASCERNDNTSIYVYFQALPGTTFTALPVECSMSLTFRVDP